MTTLLSHCNRCNSIRSGPGKCQACGCPEFRLEPDGGELLQECSRCKYIDLLQHFDVLGAEEDDVFCNQCHGEIRADEPTDVHRVEAAEAAKEE